MTRQKRTQECPVRGVCIDCDGDHYAEGAKARQSLIIHYIRGWAKFTASGQTDFSGFAPGQMPNEPDMLLVRGSMNRYAYEVIQAERRRITVEMDRWIEAIDKNSEPGTGSLAVQNLVDLAKWISEGSGAQSRY